MQTYNIGSTEHVIDVVLTPAGRARLMLSGALAALPWTLAFNLILFGVEAIRPGAGDGALTVLAWTTLGAVLLAFVFGVRAATQFSAFRWDRRAKTIVLTRRSWTFADDSLEIPLSEVTRVVRTHRWPFGQVLRLETHSGFSFPLCGGWFRTHDVERYESALAAQPGLNVQSDLDTSPSK